MLSCSRSNGRVRLLAMVAAILSFGCSGPMDPPASSGGGTFTIAMVPDTQNYVDYTHQKAEGGRGIHRPPQQNTEPPEGAPKAE